MSEEQKQNDKEEDQETEKSHSVGDIILSASKAIAFITILAFCSSYLYVVGYQLLEHKSFAPFFLPIDYVQLTPIWIVPLFSLALFAGVVAFPVLTVLMYWLGRPQSRVIERVVQWLLQRLLNLYNKLQLQSRGKLGLSGMTAITIILGLIAEEQMNITIANRISYAFKDSGYINKAMLCIVSGSALMSCLLWIIPSLRRIDASLFFFPAIFVGMSILLVTELDLKYLEPSKSSVFFTKTLRQNRPLRFAISSVPAFLVGALCAGYFSGPALVHFTKASRIKYDSEEHTPGVIEGKIIFILSRYILVLSKGSVLAIANEKVHSIETPPVAPEKDPSKR